MFLSLKIALKSLADFKSRAVLAMLGVFLGALSLTGVGHISRAMTAKAEMEAAKLGPNLFMVLAGKHRFGRTGKTPGRAPLTLDDAKALINHVSGVVEGSPFIASAAELRFGPNSMKRRILAVWPNCARIRAVDLDSGRFFTRAEEDALAKVCVVGPKLARELFDGPPRQALGKTLHVDRVGLTVVGVAAPKGAAGLGGNQDDQVFVPLSTFRRRIMHTPWITGVFLRPADGVDLGRFKRDVSKILRLRHGLPPDIGDDFIAVAAKERMKVRKKSLDMVRSLGLLSAVVSFAIGGLSILSIMVLMVRLRRLEIGVRRAMGAGRREIVRQFLFEAGLMSAVGGAAGVLCALAALPAVYSAFDFPPAYSLDLLLPPLVGSAVLGVAAGAYPAWKAAKVEILDVLRSA